MNNEIHLKQKEKNMQTWNTHNWIIYFFVLVLKMVLQWVYFLTLLFQSNLIFSIIGLRFSNKGDEDKFFSYMQAILSPGI